VETAKLLQAGVPRLGEAGLAQLSPRGLKRRLVRLDALDERVLADRSAAQAQGYYFASARDHYQQLFAVAAAQLALPARDVHGWLKLPARQRAPWLLQGDLRASAGLLLLEQAAQRRAELRARDVPLAICTNKPEALVPPLLQHLGIGDAFALVLGGDSLPQRKPSGEPLRHIAEHFALPVDACLMVGDSLTDYRAAEEAGMPIALVRYGYPRGLDLASAHAVAVIDDLRELPGLAAGR
ncbi:HAD-IA family hydrolase, partial [Mesorhizobium sp. M8A.F.Ca.ET.142.01.1.1]|uniref:HAD-IA family hydrolase n=1 Tax=Mesorhizobium sp. M8A.F.Ca.ET.142.01.1.1 TaxID=2563958 RepID=UPI001678766B